jgi:tripartite-type tricarboxylate transporter receptor subunit TctC
MVGWFAIVAPTGTPVPVINRLNAEVNKLLQDPEVAHAPSVPFLSPLVMQRNWTLTSRPRTDRWSEVAKEIGLLPE